MPIELELAHGGEDVSSIPSHGSPEAVVAGTIGGGLMAQAQGIGRHDRDRCRRLAAPGRMLITSAEWAPCRRASAQAASTADNPSLSTVRISTICLSPS